MKKCQFLRNTHNAITSNSIYIKHIFKPILLKLCLESVGETPADDSVAQTLPDDSFAKENESVDVPTASSTNYNVDGSDADGGSLVIDEKDREKKKGTKRKTSLSSQGSVSAFSKFHFIWGSCKAVLSKHRVIASS